MGGGDCLDLEFINLDPQDPVYITRADLTFNNSVEITYSSNVWPTVTGGVVGMVLMNNYELQPSVAHYSKICIRDLVEDQIRPVLLDVECN